MSGTDVLARPLRLDPGDPRIPERRQSRLGLRPDEDRRRALWLSGDPEVLRRPAIGIVGTRRPSAHGLAATRSIAALCVAHGWLVVSGMALGIDAAAHEAALDAGGETIGVLPSPAPLGLRHGARRLALRTVERGGLVSDRPPGTPAAAWSFVTRNTLLAALCDGLIVVEAPEESGALITAEAAEGFQIPLAFVTAPFGSETAAGGVAWCARARALEQLLVESRAPSILTDRHTVLEWLDVCAASVGTDDRPRGVSLQPLAQRAPENGLRAEILQRLAAAGADGLAEGDLLDLCRGAEAALPAALTLLAARGLVEQRGGRWRGSEGAVLRSRA